MNFSRNSLSILAATIATLSANTLNVAIVTAADSSNDKNLCGFSAQVQFAESAPRDRFSISNTSIDEWSITRATLDMSRSAGNLIFDVSAQGAGVEVFQPFEQIENTAGLIEKPQIDDGDQSVSLSFSSFTSGVKFQFTIDVDDQLDNSQLGQIRVSGSEMEGAIMTLELSRADTDPATVSGIFNAQNKALFTTEDCSQP